MSGVRYTLDATYIIPAIDLTVTLSARIENQELLLQLPGSWYYEGAATVSGTYGGQPIDGVGYSEQWAPYQG